MNKKLAFVLGWVTLMAVLIYNMGEANAFEILQVDEVTVVYRKFVDGSSEPLITQNPTQPGRAMNEEVDLTVNSSILKYLYWNSTIHSMTDKSAVDGSGQFRMVGLEWGLGIDLQRVWRAIPVSIGRYHYSQHILDGEWGLGHTPLENAWELRLKLYKR